MQKKPEEKRQQKINKKQREGDNKIWRDMQYSPEGGIGSPGYRKDHRMM